MTSQDSKRVTCLKTKWAEDLNGKRKKKKELTCLHIYSNQVILQCARDQESG